jgi:hypothetical protein
MPRRRGRSYVDPVFGQTPLHSDPAAQSCTFMPLQSMEQAVVPPHRMLHVAAPAHSAVHPPFGQSTMQLLSPWHVMVDPVSSVTLQALPPAQVTWLLTPAASVHELVPAQLDVQFDPQLPTQTD